MNDFSSAGGNSNIIIHAVRSDSVPSDFVVVREALDSRAAELLKITGVGADDTGSTSDDFLGTDSGTVMGDTSSEEAADTKKGIGDTTAVDADGQKFVVIDGTALLISLKMTATQAMKETQTLDLWAYDSLLSPVKIETTTNDENWPAPAPGDLRFLGVTAVGSVVYVFGGEVCTFDNGLFQCSQTDDMWKLEVDMDAKSGVWSSIPKSGSWPEKRHGHCLEVIGEDQLILFGGFGEGEVLRNDLWHYMLETETWQKLSPADPQPSPRAYFGSGVLDGKLYIVFGGDQWIEGDISDDGFMESFSSETWSWDGIRFVAP